eukprot:3072905-Rhodomonas_salina.1
MITCANVESGPRMPLPAGVNFFCVMDCCHSGSIMYAPTPCPVLSYGSPTSCPVLTYGAPTPCPVLTYGATTLLVGHGTFRTRSQSTTTLCSSSRYGSPYQYYSLVQIHPENCSRSYKSTPKATRTSSERVLRKGAGVQANPNMEIPVNAHFKKHKKKVSLSGA